MSADDSTLPEGERRLAITLMFERHDPDGRELRDAMDRIGWAYDNAPDDMLRPYAHAAISRRPFSDLVTRIEVWTADPEDEA